VAALTEDQVVSIRRQVGNAPDDAALQAIYDRTGSVDDLVLEVLEIRRAEFIRNPSSFSVSGEYSESRTADQLKALDEDVAAAAQAAGVPAPGYATVRVAKPERPACR
jgi:hypothetical protein